VLRDKATTRAQYLYPGLRKWSGSVVRFSDRKTNFGFHSPSSKTSPWIDVSALYWDAWGEKISALELDTTPTTVGGSMVSGPERRAWCLNVLVAIICPRDEGAEHPLVRGSKTMRTALSGKRAFCSRSDGRKTMETVFVASGSASVSANEKEAATGKGKKSCGSS